MKKALEVQGKEKKLLGDIIVELGLLEERDIVLALIMQCGFPYISLSKYAIDTDLLRKIPVDVVRKYKVIPIEQVGNILNVVMSDPLDLSVKEEVEQITGCKLAAFIATRSEIEEAIGRHYKKGN